MHTPTKKQWQTVIDNFNKVLPMIAGREGLDFSETAIYSSPHDRRPEGHQCGTVHCVGGWYGVAVLDIDKSSEYISYSEGAHRMATDLGLGRMQHLAAWAHENPDLWGNKDGGALFSSESAYDGAESLAQVVDFLIEVRDRSPE